MLGWVDWKQRNNIPWNFDQNTDRVIRIQKNVVGNVACNMLAISFKPQSTKIQDRVRERIWAGDIYMRLSVPWCWWHAGCHNMKLSASCYEPELYCLTFISTAEVCAIIPLYNEYFFFRNTHIFNIYICIYYEMSHVIEILYCGSQKPSRLTLSIPWLLLVWRHKDPHCQKSWYWPNPPGIIWVPHEKT